MKLSALNHKDFRIYVAGNLFALNALWMQRITIGWIAWELTRSATFVGFIAFINFVPTMIMGPLFGVLIDRVRIKHAALATQS
ncbi:MAG: MFS transporter, partial [Planktomarina sp.]|nr:MFS transporter [Planktomarina sp.]MDV3049970.1 MFS transporter [Planktomarina sp.]